MNNLQHSESFLRQTAKDYGMTVEQVELSTNHCKTSSEFYDALENEVKQRGEDDE